MTHISKDQLAGSESGQDLWRFFFRRLDYLRIHFLLERLIVERGHESKQNLLDISREMVDLTVFLWLQRERTITRHYDFDYIVSFPYPPLSSEHTIFYFVIQDKIKDFNRSCATACPQPEFSALNS